MMAYIPMSHILNNMLADDDFLVKIKVKISKTFLEKETFELV